MKNRLQFALMTLAFLAAAPGTASAHFLWIVAGAHSPDGKVHVYFAESASPDDPDLLERVGSPSVWSKGGEKAASLKATKGEESLVADPGDVKAPIWGLSHSYGVISRGGETFALKYHAKCLTSTKPADWAATAGADSLPLEIVPRFEDGKIVAKALWRGKPSAEGDFSVSFDGSDEIKGQTDKNGEFSFVLPAGKLASVRVRHVENSAGEADGKKYDSARHYATLTFALAEGTVTAKADTPAAIPEAKSGVAAVNEKVDYAPLDPPTTSFGGVILGKHVYVYGGHLGGAHNYTEAEQSDRFSRLDLAHPEKWESLGTVPKRTGFPLVAHQGKIYRIGGFVVKDVKDSESQLTSTADFARFDPITNQWEDLTPMPSGRSSHDAVVMGDQLFVFGGWELKGGEDRAWHHYGLVTDLSAGKPEWKKIPTPHLRRAVSVGEWQGKIVMVGGMQEKGGPTTATAIFDPVAGQWTDGPALVGEKMDGFGSSAFLLGKSLYVSTYSGKLQRLSDDGSQWEVAGQLAHPRFFHRMLPTAEGKLLIVGGASMETGKIRDLELLTVSVTK